MKYLVMLMPLVISCNVGSPDMVSYQSLSSSYIAVHFETVPHDTIYLSARTLNNIPNEGRTSQEIAVASPGSYYLSLVNDRPCSAFLDLNQQRFNVIILPNDTVGVAATITEAGTQLDFSGKGAAINNYYNAKKKRLGYTDTRTQTIKAFTSSATYKSIEKAITLIIDKELEFLEEYTADNTLPSWFEEYEEAEIRYLRLVILTQLPHYNDFFNLFQDKLPDQYYSFIKRESINNPKAILSSNYLFFLSDYFLSDLPVDQFNDLRGFERRNKIQRHILKRSKLELSGKVKDVFHKHEFSSMVKYFSDSSSIDSLAREYEITDYDDLLTAAGTLSRNNLTMYDLNRGDTIPDFYVVDELDSLVSIRDYADKTVYINFWATWCGPCIKNFPALNEMISAFTDREEIMFINICLDSVKDRWKQVIKRHKLKGDNLFAEGNWNNRLHAIFDISAIPDYVLIDKGNILHQNYTDKAPAVKSLIDSVLSVRGPTQ